MRKKKKHDEHVDESWLIPYADILTLLLALFIVLFATSSVDSTKYKQMVESFGGSFGGEGIMEHNSSPLPTQLSSTVDEEERSQSDSSREKRDLEEVQQKVEQYISDNHLNLHLETKLTNEGLRITILDQALFDSGSATIKEEARTLAHEISNLLVTDPPRKVSVAGHTDNVPISNSNFRSNWDLSAMRAVNFTKFLLSNQKLDPQDFSAIGYGEYQPVETNKTEQGREKNRRVEVLILPNYSLEHEGNES